MDEIEGRLIRYFKKQKNEDKPKKTQDIQPYILLPNKNGKERRGRKKRVLKTDSEIEHETIVKKFTVNNTKREERGLPESPPNWTIKK